MLTWWHKMALTERGYDKNWQQQQARQEKGYKPVSVPARYEKGFLRKLDKRSDAYRTLAVNMDEIIQDLGGIEGLSHVQKTLVEKFLFLSYATRNLEIQIATNPEGKKADDLLGRWIQALNSLVGLAKTIGFERQAKKIESLATYVTAKKTKKKKKRRRTA